MFPSPPPLSPPLFIGAKGKKKQYRLTESVKMRSKNCHPRPQLPLSPPTPDHFEFRESHRIKRERKRKSVKVGSTKKKSVCVVCLQMLELAR